MNLAIFDHDPASVDTWQQASQLHQIKFTAGNLDTLRQLMPEETCIVVLDRSIAEPDLATLLSACVLQYRHHLYVCSCENLQTAKTVELMNRGAAWVLEKPLESSQVQQCMPPLLDLATKLQSLHQEFRKLQSLFESLTSREREVLSLILDGTSNRDASGQLSISVRTVEARRARVYEKFETDNLAILLRKVERLQLLQRRFTPKRFERHATNLHHHLETRMLS